MSAYELSLVGGAILISLLAGAITWLLNTCQKQGKEHKWVRDPDHFRSRVCCNCGRCETLYRKWEYVGVDSQFLSNHQQRKAEEKA